MPVPVETVKRPYMRTAPVTVECRGDGKSVYACVGSIFVLEYGGPSALIGFGDTLADALRDLAESIEKEILPSVY